MSDLFHIGNRLIGPGQPVYIVAEMSGNHNQSYEQALQIIQAAKEAGADAVKLQTYTPDTITFDGNSDLFRVGQGSLWEGKKLYDLYAEASTPWEWHADLKKAANERGLDLFSAPFDHSSVDFLEELDIPVYKIASFENVDLPLIRRVARTGRPMIISTGMASLAEIDDAVRAAREVGNRHLALLKCTSAYPAPAEEVNLRTIPHLGDAFGVPAGLSDHTLGISVPVAAVALGACIVEKHLTISRAAGGPDSAFSLEPHEFQEMVEAIRITEKALGRVRYEATERERESRVFRRSLFVVKDIKVGEPFTEENVRSIRPGHGLLPKYLPEVLGRRAAQNIKRGTPLDWGLVG